MEALVIRPEKEQKTMWLLWWALGFVPVFVTLVVLLLTVDATAGKILLGLSVGGCLTLMVLTFFWIPAYYRSLEYVIDRNSIRTRMGVFWRKHSTIPYTKVTNIDVTQWPLQRLFDVGTIHIQTAGAGGTQGSRAEAKLVGVRDFDGIKDTILKRVREYTMSGPESVEKDVVQESDSGMLGRILNELTAIREVLEKKQKEYQ